MGKLCQSVRLSASLISRNFERIFMKFGSGGYELNVFQAKLIVVTIGSI
jgi:hypothetical protein